MCVRDGWVRYEDGETFIISIDFVGMVGGKACEGRDGLIDIYRGGAVLVTI